MAEALRDVEAELAGEALVAADSPRGLSRLIELLLATPAITETPEGKQFLAALQHYVRLKRQRARWIAGDRDYHGKYWSQSASVPTKGEVDGARRTKNYWLLLLCDQFGDDEALKLQKSFGHQVNNGLNYNSRGE